MDIDECEMRKQLREWYHVRPRTGGNETSKIRGKLMDLQIAAGAAVSAVTRAIKDRAVVSVCSKLSDEIKKSAQ